MKPKCSSCGGQFEDDELCYQVSVGCLKYEGIFYASADEDIEYYCVLCYQIGDVAYRPGLQTHQTQGTERRE